MLAIVDLKSNLNREESLKEWIVSVSNIRACMHACMLEKGKLITPTHIKMIAKKSCKSQNKHPNKILIAPFDFL